MIPTFIGITMVVFFIMRAAPGGPIEQAKMNALKAAMESQEGGASAGANDGTDAFELTDEQKQKLYGQYGISDNVVFDYLKWLKDIAVLDFGESTIYQMDVRKLIFSKMPISIFYGFITLFFTYAICIPLGVAKAIKHKTFFDNITSVTIFVGYSVPGFALASLLIVFIASDLQLLPLGGFVSDNFAELSFFPAMWDLFIHSIMPLCCYLIGSFAMMTMLMKNQLMDQMSADYVRTALAKGVPYKSAIFRHALDNSLIPIATTFGNQISLIVGGSFLIESVFKIDGIGMLGFTSAMSKDYNVVMGVLAISAMLQLLGNLLSDVCVAYVDPRVKFG